MSRPREEGDLCSRCHTELIQHTIYGIMCPKCGPGASKPIHPIGSAEREWVDKHGNVHAASDPKARCKMCGRADPGSCRRSIEKTIQTSRGDAKQKAVVWDATLCPLMKRRKGSDTQIGGGHSSIWYVSPPSYEWYSATGKVMQDKEAKKAKADQTAMNIGE